MHQTFNFLFLFFKFHTARIIYLDLEILDMIFWEENSRLDDAAILFNRISK